jgi:hypothetical protein
LRAGERLDPAASKTILSRIVSTSDQPVLVTTPRAHHYKFIGIEFSGDGSKVVHSLISLSAETYEEREQTGSFVFDRCFVHPAEINANSLSSPSKYRTVERGIQANVKDFWLINSYVAGFTGYNPDGSILVSMGVFMDVGPGPFHVINNYIEAWYSNVFLGGADAPAIPAHTATVAPGATIGSATLSTVEGLKVGDLMAFELSQPPYGIARVTNIDGRSITFVPETARDQPFPTAPLSPGKAQWQGDVLHDVEIKHNTLTKRPEWDSYSQPKNWVEIKAGRRVVIEGNLMTSGTPTNIAITVRNQNGSSPWIEINDLVFRYNKLVNFKDPAFGIQLKDNEKVTGESGNVLIEQNLLVGSTAPNSRFFLTHGGFGITFQNNTVLNRGSAAVGDAVPTRNLVIRNNIFGNGEYGLTCTIGDGRKENCWPGLQLKRNIIVDSRVEQKNSGPLERLYPPGNIFRDSPEQIGFVDLMAGNYRVGSRSPAKGAGTDGKDIGVDMDLLNAALPGASR